MGSMSDFGDKKTLFIALLCVLLYIKTGRDHRSGLWFISDLSTAV